MNLGITGCGAMGKLVRELAQEDERICQVFSVEPLTDKIASAMPQTDVLIDFSHPDALDDICDYLYQQKGSCGAVIATTGFSAEDERKIQQVSAFAPVLKSANFSQGIYMLKAVLRQLVPLAEPYADIEIIEQHHRLKKDVPAGTALMLAELCNPTGEKKLLQGRAQHGRRQNEIGIHSVRGGTICGEHSIVFAMKDEVITLKHTAYSKRIFAQGAIDAAIWLCGKKPGIYTLDDVLC